MNQISKEKLLEDMLIELIPLARRYADKRSTYVPTLVNRIIDKAIAMGIEVPKDYILEDPMYAMDGMFGKWKNGRFEKE
jgi:hypothetical protein